MTLRPLLLCLCLSAPLVAEDSPKAPALPTWSWPAPSTATRARFSQLSAAAKARLQAEFSSQSEALPALSLSEYNARFEKAFRAAVQEDEAKGLSSGGVPADLFSDRGLTSNRRSRDSTPSEPKDSSISERKHAGPSPEQRARWDKLSDASKEKVKSLFRDNRERLGKMTEEERRSFMESSFKTIEEADQGASHAKSADSPPSATSKAGDHRGASPEEVERWEKLSDSAKEKVKNMFRENRDRMSAMTADQRHSFIESEFKSIEEADQASRKAK